MSFWGFKPNKISSVNPSELSFIYLFNLEKWTFEKSWSILLVAAFSHQGALLPLVHCRVQTESDPDSRKDSSSHHALGDQAKSLSSNQINTNMTSGQSAESIHSPWTWFILTLNDSFEQFFFELLSVWKTKTCKDKMKVLIQQRKPDGLNRTGSSINTCSISSCPDWKETSRFYRVMIKIISDC